MPVWWLQMVYLIVDWLFVDLVITDEYESNKKENY